MTKPCRCEAYLDKRGKPFPHRKYSGRCYAAEDEAEAARNEEQAEAWWGRKFRRNRDERLDDPRRGHAKHINRENGR